MSAGRCSKKSSSEYQPSKIKKMTPKSVREIVEKSKQSVNKEIIVKLGEDKIGANAELTTVCVKTLVSDRTVKVKSPIPKKSSKSSSEATNLRKKFFSTPLMDGQKNTSGQKLLSITIRTNFNDKNSKIIKLKKKFDKNDKVSKNRESATESKKRAGTSSSSSDLPVSTRILPSSTRVKNGSAKNSKKIIDENSQIARRNKKSSKNHEERDLFSSSSSSDVPSAKNIFSSTSVQKNISASTAREQNGRENNCQTEGDEDVEKKIFLDKTNKCSWKEKFDKILESSNKVEGDFSRDVEVTREALEIVDDIADLEEPLFLRPQHLGVPESPKARANVEYVETTGAELPNIDSRLQVPTTRENRFDDESIDRSDNESGELHVCLDNLKTYPPRWADVIHIGTRVPRIVKRPDDFFRMSEKSFVIPPPRPTQSPLKIKFHPSDNYRANQLWDEFMSNNPEIFARNSSSNFPATNEQQNTRKRKFFKTDRNTRSGLDKSESQESPVPAKNQKKSRSKRAGKVESSSSAPKMVTIDGSDLGVEDRNVYEISSDSDDEWSIFPQKSAGQTCRSRKARDRYDRYDRLTEIEDSIEDFPSRCRSPSRKRRQERTKQSTEKRSKKPIIGDQYRSKLPDRGSSVTRSRFDDCVENQSSNVREETAIAEDRRSKRKINEAPRSSSVAAKDRRPKSLRLEDRMENYNESEIMRSRDVKEEAAIAEDRRSKRKINEASRSRSVSGNDRQPKRLGFAERMRRLKSTAESSSAIISSPAFCDDPFCDLSAQRDREMAGSTIGKNPEFMAGVRARSKVVNPPTEKIGSRKRKANESAVSKTSVKEASGLRSVLENDQDRKISPFQDKNQRTESTAASSSAFCDDPFCDLGAQKDRVMAGSTIDKNPDLMAGVRARSKVVNPPTGKIGSRKRKINESAVSKTTGESNRDIESLYDERSAIVDVNSTKPIGIFKTVETMDLIIEETKIGDFTKDHRNQDDSSTTNRTISASRQSLPIIRSDVALHARRINRIGNGRWEIVQPSTSTQISR